MDKKFPVICPSCSAELKAQSLHCAVCDTTITGSFALPLLLKLDQKEQDFIIAFVKSSGSLKIMAQDMKLSYPSVRNILDDIIEKLNVPDSHEK